MQVKELDWEAFSWIDIIDWKKAGVHEPFIIECLTMEVLDSVLEEPFSFPSFPVRTQTLERAVKLVTEASHQVLQTCKHQTNKQTINSHPLQVYGEQAHHGHILTVMDSRRRRSMFDIGVERNRKQRNPVNSITS